MLTFDKSRHMEMLYGQAELVTDTLVEFILEDIMDIDGDPVCDPADPEIVYEDFRGISQALSCILPVFLFFAGYLFSDVDNFRCHDHPNYVSKMCSTPGYYTFLYRLRPF
ncbi:hypothetical protein M8998_02795 [Sphingobacterium sp. lm-10]|uniref:hypothetical protein n=1 Tax=Sphingobacterium sp. lm-10 TaxID=2944904 RepID=UPI0020229458|nr:hypothetical protein [Sphingobacterium sp. lm-10]MCL7986863.1 hypothetical protein [Sphingobacterium sp. lm-10]